MEKFNFSYDFRTEGGAFHNGTKNKKNPTEKFLATKTQRYVTFTTFLRCKLAQQYDESWALCPELFRKKLLTIKVIINNDRSLKSAFKILYKRQLGFLLFLSKLFIMKNRVC